MNLLEIIYLCGAVAVGLILGMIVELMIDAGTVRDLQAQNRKLRLENAQLRREAKHDVVEIVDRTIEPQNVPDYSGNF